MVLSFVEDARGGGPRCWRLASGTGNNTSIRRETQSPAAIAARRQGQVGVGNVPRVPSTL
eukprot:4614478-Pyramimonas_sp.AAC.1